MSTQSLTETWPQSQPRSMTTQLKLAVILPLCAILMLQGVLALSLRNTVFQDEALYLYAGRQYYTQLIGGPVVAEPYARYFSGLPFLYPVIAGALDTYGGAELARLFSLLCMLITTTLIYDFTRRFFGQMSALLAAGLIAVGGPVLFISHFATYDAMCICLLFIGLTIASRAGLKYGLPWAIVLGTVLSFAVMTKYAALLFVPSVYAVFGWRLLQLYGWRKGLLHALVRGSLAGVVMIGIAMLIAFSNADVAEGLRFTTTARVAIFVLPRLEMLQRAFLLMGPIAILALVGLVATRRKNWLLNAILFGTVFLAPAYHIYKMEVVSMNKHMSFSILFAAPLAGYALTRLAKLDESTEPRLRWSIILAVGLAFFSLGFSQSQGFYTEWPNSSDLTTMLKTQVRPDGHILAEDSEVPRYYLQNIVGFWQWNNLYTFSYIDAKGTALSGETAYKAAIHAGYWDVIVFNYGASSAMAHAIDGELLTQTNYTLVTKIPFNSYFGAGEYWVWHKKG